MKNKLLVKLYVPSVDENYEIFIPANETIKKVVDLMIKSVNDMMDEVIPVNEKFSLFDPDTSSIYEMSLLVRDTNIVNNKKIIII